MLLALVFAPPPNGARIPSIADDVPTDLVTVRSRTSRLRRYRFAAGEFDAVRFWRHIPPAVPDEPVMMFFALS